MQALGRTRLAYSTAHAVDSPGLAISIALAQRQSRDHSGKPSAGNAPISLSRWIITNTGSVSADCMVGSPLVSAINSRYRGRSDFILSGLVVVHHIAVYIVAIWIVIAIIYSASLFRVAFIGYRHHHHHPLTSGRQ